MRGSLNNEVNNGLEHVRLLTVETAQKWKWI